MNTCSNAAYSFCSADDAAMDSAVVDLTSRFRTCIKGVLYIIVDGNRNAGIGGLETRMTWCFDCFICAAIDRVAVHVTHAKPVYLELAVRVPEVVRFRYVRYHFKAVCKLFRIKLYALQAQMITCLPDAASNM